MTFHKILAFIEKHKSNKCFGQWDINAAEHRASVAAALVNGHLFYSSANGIVDGVGLLSSADNVHFHVNQFIATNKRAKASIILQFLRKWPDAIVSSFERSGKMRIVRDSKRLLDLTRKL